MNISLRQATAADAPRVADVYLASRRTLLPFVPLVHSDVAVRRWVAEVLVPTDGVTVATTTEVIAMMAISRDGTLSWIDHLYVHPAAVGRGIGRRLLERATQMLGTPIRLYCFQANTGARRFYERHGFRPIAFRDRDANEEHCPDVLYELDGEA